MLPVEPNDEIDKELSADGGYPNGDETKKNDGWAAFSGTSAAAPQLAGICALIKQACPRISPFQARDILKRTARDVTLGKCSMRTGGHSAKSGPDLATGAGLANASEAVREARDLC
jgi:subtilisin family serine protease